MEIKINIIKQLGENRNFTEDNNRTIINILREIRENNTAMKQGGGTIKE